MADDASLTSESASSWQTQNPEKGPLGVVERGEEGGVFSFGGKA